MEKNFLKVKKVVTSFVAHSNLLYSVSYRGPCIEILLQPYFSDFNCCKGLKHVQGIIKCVDYLSL